MGTEVEPRNQDLTGSLEEAGALREQGSAAGTKVGNMEKQGGFRAPANCLGDSDV